MGSLAHFDLPSLAQRHKLAAFVETGTAQGDGLARATLAPFKALHSIEIVTELADAARARFASDQRVQLWTGDSSVALPMILRDLPPGPALFWLDAHFPGAHSGGDYAAEPNATRRLPLEAEVRRIAAMRPPGMCGDVLLIDDARIYQPGPYGAGDLPPDWPALVGVTRSLGFLRELYGASHGIVVDYSDQGYVMVVPKYRKGSNVH